MHNHEHHHHHKRKKYFYPFIIAVCFLAIAGAISWYYLSQARVENDELIAEHIKKLGTIFKRINDCCKITGFRRQKDYIDFLNVVKFEGSQVGPMNLAEPHHWDGPYLAENLNIEGKEYQVVAAKQGYYVIPGDGVKLSNGQIIGKTLRITPTTDIEALMQDPNGLQSKGIPLAAPIETIATVREQFAKINPFAEEPELTY